MRFHFIHSWRPWLDFSHVIFKALDKDSGELVTVQEYWTHERFCRNCGKRQTRQFRCSVETKA